MRTLDDIAIEHGTDKASVHPVKGHDYARHYDHLFSHIRKSARKVLEIGVGGGESVRTWLDYFHNSRVYGVDNVRDTNQWNTPGTQERYTSVFGDQSDETFWKCFVVDYGKDWDVIIDDGGHCSNQICTTFTSMWPFVTPGGFYAIEDLGVSYGSGSVFLPPGWPNHMDFIRSKMDQINLENEIESLNFTKELAVFQKR